MDIADAFHKEVITEVVKVHPRFLGSNIKTHITGTIKSAFEDTCSRHGYIRKGSVELLSIGGVQAEMNTLRGYVNASVMFSTMVCNPPDKSIVKAVVRSVNKFGAMSVCEVDGRDIMHIVVPRNILSVKSIVNIDSVQVGDRVLVEIVKRKFEVGEAVMYGIGRIVGDGSPAPRANDLTNSDDDDEELRIESSEASDVEDADVIVGDGDDDGSDIEIEEDDDGDEEVGPGLKKTDVDVVGTDDEDSDDEDNDDEFEIEDESDETDGDD